MNYKEFEGILKMGMVSRSEPVLIEEEYLEVYEQWLKDNGVRKRNAHKYITKYYTTNLHRYVELWKGDTLISRLLL